MCLGVDCHSAHPHYRSTPAQHQGTLNAILPNMRTDFSMSDILSVLDNSLIRKLKVLSVSASTLNRFARARTLHSVRLYLYVVPLRASTDKRTVDCQFLSGSCYAMLAVLRAPQSHELLVPLC
jgi:hypothetical protein